MKKHALYLLALTIVAIALALPGFAMTWSNGSDRGNGFGTHDWAMKEANDLAVAQGITWVDLDVALRATDDPDTVLHDFYYHVYDVWGSKYGNAPKRIAENMTAARAALVAGDTVAASRYIGLASHYYSDICNPLHTDQNKAEDRMHSRYETAAQKYTDSPDENDTWVTSGPLLISSPTGAAKAAATVAHKDHSTLVSVYTAKGFNSTVRTITKRSLNRAASGIAGLIISLGDVAPPPSPSPSPSPSVSPSPSLSPSPSPSPSPTTLSVSGWVSDTAPAKYSSVTAYCKAVDQRGLPISGVDVTFTWHYKSTAPVETRTTASDGVATCTRSIGNATAGYTVVINMGASWSGQYKSTSASFTPH